MSKPKAELVSLLTRARVRDAEAWADSQLEEDIAQVARAIVLWRLWPEAIDRFTRDLSWIDEVIAERERDSNAPFADAGAALSAALAAGVSPEDLGKIARFVAFSAVFSTLYRIDEGADYEFDDGPGWILMEIDQETGQPTGRDVGGLHESLLELDPTGREGRPA
jgi:alkylhydroperoxidase/carboxymuconolactone decarboxylase family protein YurZ